MRDTIFALSSGALPAAIAIIRVSGPAAFQTAEALAGGSLPPARSLALRTLRDSSGNAVDRALLAVFPAPDTVTGEPLVEFHCHGSRAVVARLLALLGQLPNCRLADPGEFTRRALLNGRLDLNEAEGLADLLSAETEWQRRAAMNKAGGSLRRQIEQWRERLILMAAEAEAAIDYVDEEETALDLQQLCDKVEQLRTEWRRWLGRPRAELLQQGIRVVLAGPPNAGKSSLFNALSRSDKAIVTAVPGTTRDYLEAQLDVEGIRLTLVDTAGMRDTSDEVERIGVDRAREEASAADLLLWLGPPDEAPSASNLILVYAQADRRADEPAPSGAINTSAVTGEGLPDLLRAIRKAAAAMLPTPDEVALGHRQALALGEAAEALSNVRADDALLSAEALRQSLHGLDRLSGRQGTEEVLDALFGRFCLGK